MQRRSLLQLTLPLAWAIGGCADLPSTTAPTRPAAPQRLLGGFLAPPAGNAPLMPPPLGSGMFIKLQSPTAVALRDWDLLVADLASNRLWRADLLRQTLSPLAAAPVGPATALALGADRSAWVLDPPSRQVLRFAVDGRLLQTWRNAGTVPVGLAVLDGGVTLAVPDAALGQWMEWRSGGAIALTVLPRQPDGARIGRIDAIAAGREHVYALNRSAALVYRSQRDGQILETLGAGALQQPVALVVDRHERVWVLDGSGRHLTRLASGAAPVVIDAESLGAQLIGGVAVDERSLAISDRLAGLVLIHPLPPREDVR
jgi:hypothetical protein